MLSPDDIKDITIFIIGAIFTGGLTFIVNWYRARHEAKIALIKAQQDADIAQQQELDRHEIDSGKLALEFIGELRNRIDQLNKRVATLESDLTTQREAGVMKDARIAELERKTAEQEEEILELRKIIADKDEMIVRLNARLESLERGRTQPGRK